MGVLNVTPDSFSDGGAFVEPEAALARGLRLVEEGADILDIGGESTRPGAPSVPTEEQIARVLPVIAALAEQTSLPLSIDTTSARVAQVAIRAGASMVNDISALTFDPDMAALIAETGTSVCLMHIRGRPETMQENPRYEDALSEVTAWLQERLVHGPVRL